LAIDPVPPDIPILELIGYILEAGVESVTNEPALPFYENTDGAEILYQYRKDVLLIFREALEQMTWQERNDGPPQLVKALDALKDAEQRRGNSYGPGEPPYVSFPRKY
jgi:hypothetical protein